MWVKLIVIDKNSLSNTTFQRLYKIRILDKVDFNKQNLAIK